MYIVGKGMAIPGYNGLSWGKRAFGACTKKCWEFFVRFQNPLSLSNSPWWYFLQLTFLLPDIEAGGKK
jgi:hypothetical protein